MVKRTALSISAALLTSFAIAPALRNNLRALQLRWRIRHPQHARLRPHRHRQDASPRPSDPLS
jgi:hypothetical protein